jgi:hypothetical protein
LTIKGAALFAREEAGVYEGNGLQVLFWRTSSIFYNVKLVSSKVNEEQTQN